MADDAALRAALNAEVTRQANVIAYNVIAYMDDVRLMFVLTMLAVPLMRLIRPAPVLVA